ncbi:hypothetical protein GCM10027162_56350 [Streptomyces incanus]
MLAPRRQLFTPRHQLLPQVLRLGLGELAAVLDLGDGQGVLVAYALEFGTELGDVLDVVPDDVAAGPGRGSGGGRTYSGWPESDLQSPSSDGYALRPRGGGLGTQLTARCQPSPTGGNSG